MDSKRPPAGYSIAELAALLGCSRSEIEALARSRRWPRVDRHNGMRVVVDLATVRRDAGCAAGVFTEANA